MSEILSPSNNGSMPIPATETNRCSIPMRLISLGLTLLIFGIFAGGFYFWDVNNFLISPALSYTAIFACCPIGLGLFLYFRHHGIYKWRQIKICPPTCCLGLLLVFFSDWLTRGFNLFQGPMIRGELICIFLILFIFLKKFSNSVFTCFAVSSCFVLFSVFIYQSSGFPILSDDHASFIFRLSLLKDYFPNIPLYHPLWNAGLDARDFFATGSISFFLLTAPLQYFFSISDSYNFSVAFLLFIVLPASLAYATKLTRIASPGPAIAAIIGVTTSLVWYRWSLKYGTMGFVTSAALMPMVFVLGCRLISNQKLSIIQLILFIISASLACMWPLGGSCYLGLAIIALFNLKLLIRNKQLFIAVFFLLLINLPWAALFWKVSKVGNFIKAPAITASTDSSSPQTTANNAFRHKQGGLDFKKALKAIREQANGTNPLILFLFIPGLNLLGREFRKPFIVQTLLLAVGGSLLVTIKPQLELDRLLVFLSILLTIPTTKSLVYLLQNNRISALLPSVAFSFVFLSPWITSNILHNRSAEIYHFGDQLSENITHALKENISSGRAVFSGFVLHELGGGHVAPLATWSNKPLVASSPFHNKWKYTGVFPANFIERGDAGINEFLDLMNAEVVLAHEAQWRNYFLNRPDQYELVWQQRPFLMFKRKNFISNYFHAGSGEIIKQTSNSVHFKLTSDEAILKFNYFPFLKIESCETSPYEAGLEFPLIKVSNCHSDSELILKSIAPLERLLK